MKVKDNLTKLFNSSNFENSSENSSFKTAYNLLKAPTYSIFDIKVRFEEIYVIQEGGSSRNKTDGTFLPNMSP